MQKICVMSRFQAARLEYPLEDKTGIISIYGSLQSPVKFKEDPNLIEVLPLQFDDVDMYGENHMTEVHAKAIYEFLKRNAKDIDTLIVHCNFGACRSAAVAAAIMKAFTGDDTAIFNYDGITPNTHCYNLTLKELLDENGNSKIGSGIKCEFVPRKWEYDNEL